MSAQRYDIAVYIAVGAYSGKFQGLLDESVSLTYAQHFVLARYRRVFHKKEHYIMF